uniref:Fe2OG dioxygenase domain-containing protein n=1 Tax=Grammatophora oceanica TaxID=210454 RepID=A0A7S1VFE7_9STRA
MMMHFGLKSLEEIRLDDAFCVHYNMDQDDTSGSKHTDPSDITINLCVEKTKDVEGSHVKFYGAQKLENVERQSSNNDREAFLVDQLEGYATIHWGVHPHETMPLKRGVRTNLILTYCYKDPSRSDVSVRSCYF